MAQAGLLPPDILLKKEVLAVQARMAGMPEGAGLEALPAKIARLRIRQAIAEG